MRNFFSLKDTRAPYRSLEFPKWVKVTYCETVSNSYLISGRHGVRRAVVRRPVQ